MIDWSKPIQCMYDGVIRPARHLGQVKTKFGSRRLSRLVAVDQGDHETVVWTNDDGDESEFRIFTNVPVKHVRWVNVYESYCEAYKIREIADNLAERGRIACLRVEFEEGEGL